jgi:hypothetical protein
VFVGVMLGVMVLGLITATAQQSVLSRIEAAQDLMRELEASLSKEGVTNARHIYTRLGTLKGQLLLPAPQPEPVPVDCAVSDWTLANVSPWSVCAQSGSQSRTETWERTIVTLPAHGGAACGALHETRTASQSCEPDPLPTGSHGYFDRLAALPGATAYSLRSAAMVDQYRRNRSVTPYVSYDPASDPDPRRQDAMKITIPDTANGLPTQVWLPTGHTPLTTLFVTFDAWWGKEFRFETTGVDNHKSWQIGSPNEDVYTEFRTRFGLARGTSSLSYVDIRQYADGQQGPNVVFSPVFNGRTYGSNAIGPMVGDFAIAPETWTRVAVYFELQEDQQWYRMSMWVSDETRDPVLVYDGLQLRPKKGPKPHVVDMGGAWGTVRVEYNTSHSTVVAGRGPLVSYARNVVTVNGLTKDSVLALLQRPVR